jgi:hypothetical protein
MVIPTRKMKQALERARYAKHNANFVLAVSGGLKAKSTEKVAEIVLMRTVGCQSRDRLDLVLVNVLCCPFVWSPYLTQKYPRHGAICCRLSFGDQAFRDGDRFLAYLE